MEGHFEGMLDRDQRTAKLRFYENSTEFLIKNKEFLENSSIKTMQQQPMPVSHSAFPRSTSSYTSYFTNKKGHIWSSIQRLKRFLILGAYLTLALSIPKTLSAPVSMGEPKWINPCGIATNGPSEEKDNFKIIIDQANNTRDQAGDLMKGFLNLNFHFEYDTKNFDDNPLDDWYPKVPKKYGQTVPLKVLESFKFEDALVELYRNLQISAVTLEQLVVDIKDKAGDLHQSFEALEDNLRSLLCFIFEVISSRNLKIENVERSHMPNEARYMSNTNATERNWLIYREFMNSLEYAKDFFVYYSNLQK